MIMPLPPIPLKATAIQDFVAREYDRLEEQLVCGAISAAKYALLIENLDEWAQQQYNKAR
jgi:hypothetical protein